MLARRHAFVPCTLLFLAACTDPSARDLDVAGDADPGADPGADPDADLDDEALTLPKALVRAGVAPFIPQPELVDPPPPAPIPGPVPPRPSEGDYLLVRGALGATWVPYHLVGDDVMIGDDILLGSVTDVFGLAPDSTTPETRALGESDLNARWPDGIVYYAIDLGVGIPNTIVIADTLARLEATLPIRFVESDTAANRVTFELWDKDFGLSTGVGMVGGEQKVLLQQTTNVRTVAHELLHVLGRFHEQQRPDRAQFVDYYPDCVRDGADGNFTAMVGELPLGPYDLGSLMHYRGTSQCREYADGPMEGQCECAPLRYKGTDDPVESPTSGCDQTADPVCFFSDLDIGSMWTMYGDFTADGATSSDYLGWATAAGDFDGDGLDDIASSAVLAEGWKGKVMTFKGSYGIQDGQWAAIDPGIVPWRVLRRSPFAAPATSDLFGMSLVAADFDGDGFDDLAVGAPGASGHGAVYVFRGSRAGLVPGVELSPTTDAGNLPFAGADYGAALAAADLDGDGVADLIVGAPGDRPGVGLNPCGGVYTYRLQGAPDLLARWNPPGTQCQADAEAGAAVAGTTRNGTVGRQLVVGAPGADSDRGRAWILSFNNTPTLTTAAHLTQGSPQACGVGGVATNPREVGDRFGAAIAAGKRTHSQHVIAIGSPGEDDSAGQVDVFRYDTSCWLREDHLTQSVMAAHEAGDRFGAALAIGDLTADGTGDLLVGAPGEAVGTVTAGWMYSFRGTGPGFVAHAGFGQSTGGWINGTDERFGSSFALAEVDGNIVDLVVGAPGNHVGAASYAGSVFLWQSRGDAVPAGWRALSVDSKSPYAR